MDINELAERLDQVLHDFDPYEYADTDGSVEKAKEILETSPLTVIENLLDMIEEQEERLCH